jgi:hypothetical protein
MGRGGAADEESDNEEQAVAHDMTSLNMAASI